jgi:hypothetical protein
MERLNTNLLANEISYSKARNMFFVHRIIRERENKRKKIIGKYNDIMEICIGNIDIAHKMGKQDTIFKIPNFVPSMPEYTTTDCMKFISERLNELYMDFSILAKDTIFITWKYIELNRLKQKEINS